MEIGNSLKIINVKRAVLYLVVFALIIGGGILIPPQFEWHEPTVNIKLGSDYIGHRPFEVEINEKGKGLRKVSVSLLTAGKEYLLVSNEYDLPIMEENITVTPSPEKLGLGEGPAVLQVKAADRSYWRFFRGNEAIISKNVSVDLTPPAIQLISANREVNFGGSGLVIYQSSPDTIKSGVRIGQYFFRGYKGYPKEPKTYIAFFSHPYDVAARVRTSVVAEDAAGNSTEFHLSYRVMNVKYKRRTVNVTDSYIEKKVAPLLGEGPSQQDRLRDVFVKVNRDLRKENDAKIREICAESTNAMLWRGPFHQLSNSKVEASFADRRTYVYKGEIIDHAYHLGYDLAVTRNYPVEAANHGVVVFADDLGIYGNTVIIDHGFGIFTMYNHMSSITVKEGEKVKQKHIIGKTGETGLATGDHLHYATLIHGVPVLPLEWWDGRWVKDNILRKIQNTRQAVYGFVPRLGPSQVMP